MGIEGTRLKLKSYINRTRFPKTNLYYGIYGLLIKQNLARRKNFNQAFVMYKSRAVYNFRNLIKYSVEKYTRILWKKWRSLYILRAFPLVFTRNNLINKRNWTVTVFPRGILGFFYHTRIFVQRDQYRDQKTIVCTTNYDHLLLLLVWSGNKIQVYSGLNPLF